MTDLRVLQSVSVNNSHFNQSIGWKKVTSDNQNISHYIIKYGLSSVVNSYDSEGVNCTTSTSNSATLTLPLSTSPTTYNVWVAAVSDSTGTGKYSEVLEIIHRGNLWSKYTMSCKYITLTDSVLVMVSNTKSVYHKGLIIQVCIYFLILQHQQGPVTLLCQKESVTN